MADETEEKKEDKYKHHHHHHGHHHGHCGPPWPGPWWPAPIPPFPFGSALCESWLHWAASRAAFRRRWWQSMADAAYQTRKGYDWCYPDWCYPDWCDPCADMDEIDPKKIEEALKSIPKDKLDGDEAERVIDRVMWAVRQMRRMEAGRRKTRPTGGRYRYRD